MNLTYLAWNNEDCAEIWLRISIFHGSDKFDFNKYSVVTRERITRNNGKSFRWEKSKSFFFNRIVNIWNSLPAQVVSCNTIDFFKTKLDKYLSNDPNINYFAPRYFFFFLSSLFNVLYYCLFYENFLCGFSLLHNFSFSLFYLPGVTGDSCGWGDPSTLLSFASDV